MAKAGKGTKRTSSSGTSHLHGTRPSSRRIQGKKVRFAGDDQPPKKKGKKTTGPKRTASAPDPTPTPPFPEPDQHENLALEEEDEYDYEGMEEDASMVDTMGQPSSSPPTVPNPLEGLTTLPESSKVMIATVSTMVSTMLADFAGAKATQASPPVEKVKGMGADFKGILGNANIPEMSAHMSRPSTEAEHLARLPVIMRTEAQLRRALNDGNAEWWLDPLMDPAVREVEQRHIITIYKLIDRLAKHPWVHVAHFLATRFKRYVDTGDAESFTFCPLDFDGCRPDIRVHPKPQPGPGGNPGSGRAPNPTTNPNSQPGKGTARPQPGQPFTGSLPPPNFGLNRGGKPFTCPTCNIFGWGKSRCPVCNHVPAGDWAAWDTRTDSILSSLKELARQQLPMPSCPAASGTYNFNS